jgi:cytochrome c
MFDTMTFTKVLGSFCGALPLFLLGSWAAEEIYHTGYVIEVASADDGAVEEEGPDLLTLIASADVGKGERVFGKCKACHKLEDGANGTGPHLWGTVNRAKGAVDGFGYSDALGSMGGSWGYEELDAFLANPKGYVAGTKMSFSGLKKPEERANLIAYLETVQ